MNVTRRQGLLLKALQQRGQVAAYEESMHLECHHDLEPKELAKVEHTGLVEKTDDAWTLSDEGAEVLDRADAVMARFRDRGINMQWP